MTLLVGTNNSGKTSVLEAAEILLGGGSPRALIRGAVRRHESVFSNSERVREIDLAHLFRGHGLELGSRFRIEGEDGGAHFIDCEVVSGSDAVAEEPAQPELALSAELEEESPSLALKVTSERSSTLLPLSPEGGVTDIVRRRLAGQEPAKTFSVAYVGPESDTDIVSLWDQVVLTPEEQKVVEALRSIEPTVERIAAVRRTFRGGMVVKLAGSDLRIPIGSMGDGIRRLLALSIMLASHAGGYLLVDEIDTGLHHSVMSKMWRLIVESSRRLGIQIIASTHSADCVQALAALYEESNDLRDLIALHRVERGQAATIRYGAEELSAAAKQNMEVR